MSRDPLITFCMAHGLALDRKTYIAGAYPQGKPDPWTAEHEAELPAIFREPRKWALISRQVPVPAAAQTRAGGLLNCRNTRRRPL